MGLIYGKNGIRKLMVGYPTVADKYDVFPAVLDNASAAVYPGDVVVVTADHSVYEAASSIADFKDVAGIVIATNVKVPTAYPAPAGPVAFQPGEAFGLCKRGFIAVKLDADAVLANATENAPVFITAAGKITTVSTSNIATPWKFTGVSELHGSDKVAEIVM